MGQKIPAKEKYHILTVPSLSAHNAKEYHQSKNRIDSSLKWIKKNMF